ncbi:expressed unknown protein [Seminavis robusta]|uniref:Arf-GAP domain-containing protein n=1 Tax=Seminavis robusta TaxID=568900 RepID=A0A9N8HC87_9STRA|nr:expressed unknown protein [Seminavis robusta]|eukprot:Sro396_g134350.1 n/a (432) ;mRNA; f:52000-53408
MTGPTTNSKKKRGADSERMMFISKKPGNQTCADCPSKYPTWGSFLMTAAEDNDKGTLAVLCCQQCAQLHHQELGSKRCKIIYAKVRHEWSTENIAVLDRSGNSMVNGIYEATLTSKDFDKAMVLPDENEESKRRAKFIKNKYKKLKYCCQTKNSNRDETDSTNKAVEDKPKMKAPGLPKNSSRSTSPAAAAAAAASAAATYNKQSRATSCPRPRRDRRNTTTSPSSSPSRKVKIVEEQDNKAENNNHDSPKSRRDRRGTSPTANGKQQQFPDLPHRKKEDRVRNRRSTTAARRKQGRQAASLSPKRSSNVERQSRADNMKEERLPINEGIVDPRKMVALLGLQKQVKGGLAPIMVARDVTVPSSNDDNNNKDHWMSNHLKDGVGRTRASLVLLGDKRRVSPVSSKMDKLVTRQQMVAIDLEKMVIDLSSSS